MNYIINVKRIFDFSTMHPKFEVRFFGFQNPLSVLTLIVLDDTCVLHDHHKECITTTSNKPSQEQKHWMVVESVDEIADDLCNI